MSETPEVAIVLGRPDYDLPLGGAVLRMDGAMMVVGRDELPYLWRFEGDRASLWAVTEGAVGAALGTIVLPRAAAGDVEARCALLRDAQGRMRTVQAAWVNLAETLWSLADETPRPALGERLHAVRERLGPALLMLTDPADDSAHAAFRPLPEVVGIAGAPRTDEDRMRLRPLAVVLLGQHAGLLGIDDPDGLLALASP